MSKAVLVLEMPEGCVNCALCRKENRKGYNDYICVPKNQLAPMAIGADRPDWCPLRFLPEKEQICLESNEWSEGIMKGWNDCLRAIEGSGEDEAFDSKKWRWCCILSVLRGRQ